MDNSSLTEEQCEVLQDDNVRKKYIAFKIEGKDQEAKIYLNQQVGFLRTHKSCSKMPAERALKISRRKFILIKKLQFLLTSSKIIDLNHSCLYKVILFNFDTKSQLSSVEITFKTINRTVDLTFKFFFLTKKISEIRYCNHFFSTNLFIISSR